MERNKEFPGGGDAVRSYCPHLGENVIMLRTRQGEEDRFSCLRAGDCEKSGCRCACGEKREAKE